MRNLVVFAGGENPGIPLDAKHSAGGAAGQVPMTVKATFEGSSVMLFFLGAAAGMLNVWRIVSGRGLATGYFEEHRQDAGKTVKDE